MGQKEGAQPAQLNTLNPGQAALQQKQQAQRLAAQNSVWQSQPSICVLLGNMWDPEKVDLTKNQSFFIDLKDDVKTFCSDFGKVDLIYIEQNSNGNVWIRFEDDLPGAIRTQSGLNNQFFDNRPITANFVAESIFNTKYK